MEIELDYCPRAHFQAYHDRTQRFAIGVAHRRAGKTVATINDLIRATALNPLESPRSAFITPLFNQAKDVAWTYLKHYAAPLLAKSPNETELFVELVNGGRIRLYGADNPDRLRGIYLDDVVLDENADMNPRVWPEIIRPLLADRHGRATFIGTPRGHNAFRDLFLKAKTDPDWFRFELKASQTNIISPQELQAARRDMSEDQYQQEFECSFDAAIQGAYFADYLRQTEAQNRITRITRDPILDVRTFWDLGVSDSTSIWVAQYQAKQIIVLDYIEGQGQPLAYYVEQLRHRGYDECLAVLPHDAAHRDSVMAVRYEDHLKDAGFRTKLVKNQGKGAAMQRIETVRRLFPMIWFNDQPTQQGRDALAYYHERRDENRNIGLGPEHDWSSHAADAFGLMCVAYEEPKRKKDAEQTREVYVEDAAGLQWLGN